ncbi:MAG TPA: glycosyl hydrolase [archaeon]|nr:glycosyl hydrolase [archaeon]
MNSRSFVSSLLVLIVMSSGCASRQKEEADVVGLPSRTGSFARLKSLFADPPVEFRSAPLWVWNDNVTEEQIDRQLADLKKAGIGGVFIHPRPGLVTPYLSDRWHSLCRHTVDRAKEMGMQVWIYDENSYPSGFAGGHVPAEMPESYNQGQGLVLHRAEIIPQSLDKKYMVVLEKEGSGFVDITDSIESETGKKGDYYLFEKAFYGKSPWFGGFSYVDLLHEGVTGKFIELTMRGYQQRIGDEFGKAVRGVFTDEPNIAPPAKDCIRWTPELFKKFRERRGYDLAVNLPSLFEEIGDWKRVRHDYYALLLDMFIERWSKPWYAYCEEHHLLWTGHYWEHGWPSPHHGGDNMAMYAWHHVPAIDILMNDYREEVNAQFGNVRAVKELASAANQMGRNRALSETYGAGGWDLRFEDMKRIGDWEYVLGVNFMNQHLSYMTISGARKRDHPQSFSYHEPWWKYYGVVNGYFNRLSLALSAGEQVNSTLVLEPTTSAWMYHSPSAPNPRIAEIGSSFQSFLQNLEKLQVEYDLGCENIIKDHGAAASGVLTVGRRSYDLVVFPPGLDNLEQSTIDRIRMYLESGGTILSFGGIPRCIDGIESNSMQALAEQYAPQWVSAGSPLDTCAWKLLSSKDFRLDSPDRVSGKLSHHRRKLEDGELVFLVNTSLDEHAAGSFTIHGGAVERLDPVNGVICPYPAQIIDSGLKISFDILPAGSLLLYIDPAGDAVTVDAAQGLAESNVPPSGNIRIERKAPNALTLDYCDVTIGGQELKDRYFYSAADTVFKYYGFNGNPWSRAVQYKTDILDRNSFPVGSGFDARFVFRVEAGVTRESLQAVIEHPELWEVAINGQVVKPRPGEWRFDRSFGLYDIGTQVIEGLNSITLHAVPMTIHSELEPVYIMGDFGLEAYEKGWKMVPEPQLTFGAWSPQRMPFYSDGVEYTGVFALKEGTDNCRVRLGKWLGSVAIVTVNGESAGIIGWPPYEADISRLVKPGDNDISVIVHGTLKNQLGPHHNKPAHGRAWPAEFESAPEHQPAGTEYDVIGYGLFEPFMVITRQ